MKNGILNLPDKTRSLKAGSVGASKGKAPQTRTYRTTPRDCKKQIQLVKNKLFCKVLWFGKMAINQLLSEMCEILREHRCAILCKRQSLFFILLQFMVRMMLWLPWLPFSIWFKSLAQRGIPVEKIATLEDECHAYCLLTINSGSAQFQIPPKSLNVHDFGMKMYAPQPITALLERKAELPLAKRCTF